MSSGTLTSVGEYLSTTYRPDREYVDGLVLERNLGELDHSSLQTELAIYLGRFRKQLGIWVYVEQRVQVTATRFRVPDVCVVAGQKPEEQIFTRPPFICIEILSKEDRLEQMQERLDDYLAFGVPYVWLLNPRTRKAYRCVPGAMHEVEDNILRTANPEILVPLAEVFA